MTAVLHDDRSAPTRPRPTAAAVVVDLGRVGPQDLGAPRRDRHGAGPPRRAHRGPHAAARSCCTRGASRRSALAVALRRSFADLGPTFIKLGQLVASSPGPVPRRSSRSRCGASSTTCRPSRPAASAAPSAASSARRSATCSRGSTPRRSRRRRWRRCTAPACTTAREVVVKVRRPNLRGRVERDLRLLRLVAGALGRMGALGEAVNPVGDRRRPRPVDARGARLPPRGARHGAASPPTWPASAPTSARSSRSSSTTWWASGSSS